MTLDEIKNKITSTVSSVKLRTVGESLLIENPVDLPKVATFLKECPGLELDYLSSVTGSDFLEYLESVYHLYSMKNKTASLTLRVRVSKDNPKVPSLVPVYRGAEFQEREAYDMYGIVYENHPDLRRIFMWEGFEAFPMRKDYVQEDSEVLESQDVEWLEKHGAKVPDEMKKKAEELKAQGVKAVAKKGTE